MTKLWKKAMRKSTIIEFREVEGESEDVKTLHGTVKAEAKTEYILKTIMGDVYPCDKILFHEIYEVIE